ncbi:DEAD/DEAH box helicase [Agilicoccus flavus]|uniref:DEAD/DEAH box helicase n=1 Tax=Agilicoccus flavus TaxID=2775968 RepID=UPI001CF69FD0|nr:DEAD/DEAH box helicase [Agilicoccus flavus]
MTSATGFDRLHPVVQHHVVNTLGWPALRALQEDSIAPILRGDDALLLAPTAGGKTEAALFPLLTRMDEEDWSGTSVLYVCPLKALLNNLHPRVAAYAGWLGRTAAVRHGDVGAGARRRQAIDRPDILLTTPESIESLLVSTLYDPSDFFSGVRAVVVDEVHAFAGDDRGWHLLAVLERVAALAGRPLQRVGCSATVGNARDLLAWLQGSNRAREVVATVVAPVTPGAVDPEVGLDFVGTVPNAATVVAQLHQGEKRLVFADSRRTVEQMSVALRDNGTETFVSHSSLSLDERRRAEAAFAEARDCVIVSTSTLELGIDVGDLDRVLQLGSPRTVASFLQRLGRTGRRPGTSRNTLFLGLTDDDFLRACGLLLLWSEGFVEAVEPPAAPLHIVGQQILGLALQRGTIARGDAWDLLSPLALATRSKYDEVMAHLIETGFLDVDGDVLFIGPESERRFGRRHFLDLMAVFLAAPEVKILNGREEVGSVDPIALTMKRNGPRVIALGGRSWLVTYIDWKRHRAYVEPVEGGGQVQWSSPPVALSPQLCDAMRRVLLGETPVRVSLSRRATDRLATLRRDRRHQVDELSRVIVEDSGRVRWWTWAGLRQNARYVAALDAVAPELLDDTSTYDNLQVALRSDADTYAVASAVRAARSRFGDDLGGVTPAVDERALRGLKFAELLPLELAREVLGRR